VEAREGQAAQSSEIQRGGEVERLSVRFFVERGLLAQAPEIDSVFTIQGREAGPLWRLESIDSGLSPHDPEWVFACVEEHA
jgi:hypothetical protein